MCIRYKTRLRVLKSVGLFLEIYEIGTLKEDVIYENNRKYFFDRVSISIISEVNNDYQ